MYGNRYVTREVRRFQRTYEDRANGYRRHIEFLIRERQLYQDKLEEVQPTFDADEQRLSHLEATIRDNITQLQQHTLTYRDTAEKWHQLVGTFHLADHRDTDDWARSMHDSVTAFFQQPDLHQDLDAQFEYLITVHLEVLAAVREHEARTDPVRQAGFQREASTPATTTPAASDLAAAAGNERRTSPGPLSDSARSPTEKLSDSGPLSEEDRDSPAQASSRSHDRHRVTINDDPRRHYYTDASASTSATGPYSMVTVDAYPAPSHSPGTQQPPATHRGVPVVQQLDFGDGTTPSASPPLLDDFDFPWGDYASPGIMAYTDGNVAATSPMAWHSQNVGMPAHFTTYTSAGPVPLAASIADPALVTRPTRPAPLPPSRTTAPVTTTTTTTSAGGRGPFTSLYSGPTTLCTSVHVPRATLPSGPLGPSAAAPTTEAHSDLESASAFYRNATFHRDTTNSSQLVLKEIPITPFDGNIRQFPTFRNRFLDIVEGQPNLAPRHKLQYLLQYLRGAPYDLATNYQLTDENYFAVVNLLEERYGNKDMIRNLLMRDLIALRPPTPAMADLRRFHGEALRVTTDLKQLGDDVDSNRLYEQTLMSKLSPALKVELIRNSNYATEKTVTSILTGLNTYTGVLELAATTGLLWSKPPTGNSDPPGRRTPTRPSSPRYPSNTNHTPHAGYGAETEDVPDAEPRPDRQSCAFCGLSHWAPQCTRYRSITQRYIRAKKLGMCFLCLRGNHWTEKCPLKTSEPCRHCDRRVTHHRAFCSKAPSRTWKQETRRQGPVRNQDPRAPRAPSGESPRRGSSAERHAPVKKAVNWSDSRVESTARFVPPSAPRPSGEGNSKKINRRKKSKSPGTGSKGRKGTSRPTTASTVEDIPTKGVHACDDDRLLSAHQSLLTTARCPTTDSPQYDWPGAGSDDKSPPHDEDPWGDVLLDGDESEPESIGHDLNAPLVPSDAYSDDYDWFPPYEEPTAFAVSASLPADTRTVLLECAKVTAVNPTTGASRQVTAFFDQGSTLSYVSTALANGLDLPQQGHRRLRVNTFGSSTPLVMEGFATNLLLRTPGGTTVSLNATAAPDCIVKAVTTALVEDHELPPLLQNKVALISSRETPDILIGQDTIQRFKRQVKRRLPSGFDLIHTILGPMIGGAGRVANPSKADATTAFVVTAVTNLPDPTRITQFPPPPSKSKFSTTTLTPPLGAESAQQALTAGSGPLSELCPEALDDATASGYFSGLADKSDAEIFGDFSYLENAGIGTSEMTPDDQAAADMLEKLITREPDGRYKVPLLFRTPDGEPPSNTDLPTNMNLGKGRGISTRNSLAKAPKKLAEYDGIITDYKARKFISKAPINTKLTKHCLSHHPVHKETSTTTATRPVYDASAKLPGRSCLNDWLYRGPVLLPTVPAVLLRSRLPQIIVVCDIGKAFLQVAVKESHRDCLWFVWFKDPTNEPTDENIVLYRFDRVPFGLKSSPYLLAGVIKKHLESEATPLAHEMLKNCYVDNVLLMADTVDEALQKYHQSKAIFAKAQMPLREYASNSAKFNDALEPADRADLNKLRELGIRWDVTADYWDIPLRPKPPQTRPGPLSVVETAAASGTGPLSVQDIVSAKPADSGPLSGSNGPVPSKKPKRNRRKKVDDGRLTKRSMLRFVAQIYDPQGLVQAALLLAKLVIQEFWKAGMDWDDDVSPEHARLWEEAIRDFDTTTIRIPRRIAVGKIDSAKIHVFTDGSSQAYGLTAYLRVLDSDGTYRTNLVYARAKVKPIKDAEKFTIPRMELLGVLIGSRAIKFLHQELDIKITATYLWSDATIVLHQVADTEKIKEVFVHNRLKEIRSIRDEFHVDFRHVPTADNPADIISRGIAAADLQRCEKWWFGAPFLALDSSQWPKQPPSLTVGRPPVDPQEGSDTYGSTAFAALYADAFIPEVSWRKLRRRKKPNPLDTITQPLPPTIFTVSAVAAITVASDVRILPPEGAAPRPPPKLPPAPILPPVIGDAHFRWTEHVRITYYVLRAAAIMLRGARQRLGPRRRPPALGFALEDCLLDSPPRRPSLRDLHVTEMIVLRKAQLSHPPSDADRQNLGIFEHQGLLYVKGRLGNMKLRPTALTPIYLPRQAPEAAYIIIDYHRNNGHAGTTTTLANIRMRYWFTQGRRTVQSAIRAHCFECRREAMQPCITPPWPQLPLSRVSQTRPFYHCGLDFFGPVYLRRPRDDGGHTIAKYSVAIFTCMTFRCVHLELCPDLSTQSFLDAFQRFGSRREFPARILSDNGLSFLTAREVIKQLRENHAPPQPVKRRNPARAAASSPLPTRPAIPASDLTPDEERITDFCHRNNIEWQTITELSPWRGGSYERLIGIVKHSLKRSIGKSKPTEEQYRTLLASAERTTNCRPLSYVADSDADFYLIRPIDILHPLLRDEAQKDPLDPPTDPTQAQDDPDFVAPGENRLHAKLLRDLKKARDLADVFWQEFRDGVLLELRNRGIDSKRRQLGQNTIQAGDLVLVKEAGLPRTDWRLALVLELLPSADNLERSARIRFGRTHEETNRALEHLYPIGNVPARVTTSCSIGAIADYHSVFLISVVDTAMNAQQPRSESSSEAGPLSAEDSGNQVPPNNADQAQSEPCTPETLEEAVKRRLFEQYYSQCSQLAAELRIPLDRPRETTDVSNVQRIVLPFSSSLVAVARADHQNDQEDTRPTTISSNSGSGPLSEKECDDRTAISSDSDSAHPAATVQDDSLPTKDNQADPAPDVPPLSETGPLSVSEIKKVDDFNWEAVRPEAPSVTTTKKADDFDWDAVRPEVSSVTETGPLSVPETKEPDDFAWDALHAKRLATGAMQAEQRRQRLLAAAAERQRRPMPIIVPGITTLAAASATDSLVRPPPRPVGLNIDPFEASPLVDWTRMPAYMSIDEIWDRTRQFFSFEQADGGHRLAKIDNETLMSNPLRFAQESFFCIKKPLPGLVDNSPWQPSVVCCGQDEPRGFHVSIGATLIIIKNKWLRYRQIAAIPRLHGILEGLMRLHIRTFGQMILVVYAAHLAGDHDRMGLILQFLDGVLRARDLDLDIADCISCFVPRMVRGVDAKKHPYPYEDDFEAAAERWCCYCYKAFVFIYERLSGLTCWSPEWLRATDIPKEFKRAIDNIVMKAQWILLTLKERIYKLYVLRRLQAAEAGETFLWTPLKFGRRARADDWPETLHTRLQKWVLLVDDENDYLFCDELHQDKVSIIRVPSTNRADVLRVVRSVMPGAVTDRIYLWFGTEYINAGNNDYGQLVTELCHHFTSFLGHIDQYVVLPPYNRLQADAWTNDVLGLYLQKDLLLPNARVILHPYDVRLWFQDQKKFIQLGQLPAWTDAHQSANGTINNWSTVEARKLNMQVYHGSDHWTWYKKDARAHDPPASIHAKIGRNGQVIKDPPSTTSATETESEDGRPPVDHPSTSTSSSQPSTNAAVAGPLQATSVLQPPRDAQQSSTSQDSGVIAASLRADNTLLATLLEDAVKKATDQMFVAFQPRIDDLIRRMDALAARRSPSAMAEDRHQEPRIEQ